MPAPQAITYGGQNLSQYFVGIEISRTVIPDVNVETLDIPGRNGTTLMGYRLDPLEIKIIGTLNARTAAEVSAVRHALASILIPEGTKQLVLPDETGIFYNAIPTGSVSLDRNNQNPKVSITFYVPEGCGIGSYRTLSLSSGYQTVDVGGNIPTWPTYVINTSDGTATVTQETSYSQNYARETHFTLANGGSTVSVDSLNEIASTANILLESDFQPLDPRHICRIKASNGGTLQWFERWL